MTRQEQHPLQRSRVQCAVLWLIVLLTAVFLLLAFLNPGENLVFNSEPVRDFSDDWQLLDQDGLASHPPLTLPEKIDTTQAVRIAKVIPEGLPSPAVLGFRSTQQRVRIFCNETLIYDFGHSEAPLFGKSPGSGWNLVRLPQDSAGMQLILELDSPYPFYQGRIQPIQIGSKAALVMTLLGRYGLSLALTLFILGTGIITLLAYLLILNKSIVIGKEALYLGLFAVFISFWLFGESQLTQFFAIPPAFNTCFSIVAMLATPVPLFYYISCGCQPKDRRALRVVAGLLFLLLVCSVLLQMYGLLDLIEQLVIIHSVFVAGCAFLLYTVVADCIHRPSTDQYRLVASLGILLAFFAMELMALYSNGRSVGSMMRIGVLFFIAMQAQTAFKNASQIIRLSRLASIDALTGCFNRTAYHQRLDELEGHSRIGVIVADIDGLKLINDTYGHEVGDDAIVRCAGCFTEAFSPYGRCFRIGGDEFVMLGKDLSAERLQSMGQHFSALNKSEGAKTAYPFLVSFGSAFYDPQCDQSLASAVRRADDAMYQNKRQSKLVAPE